MPDQPRRFKPGAAWMPDRGKLYLFTNNAVIVVRPWPNPMAWRLGREGPWHGVRPYGLPLDAPELVLRQCGGPHVQHYAQAFAAIPVPQRRLAARFFGRAWHLHALFSRVPGSQDLALRNPALAAALACSWCLRKPVQRPLRSARGLLRRPGPQICRAISDWLGFGSERSTVRILGKFAPEDCTVPTLQRTKVAVLTPSIRKKLLHLSKLNGAVLRLVTGDDEFPPNLPFSLLVDVSNRSGIEQWQPLKELRTAARLWARIHPDRTMPLPESVHGISVLHDELHHDLARDRRRRALTQRPDWRTSVPYPAAPVANGEVEGVWIQAVRTPIDLYLEGKRMHHCIGSARYSRAIAAGRGFAFTARHPHHGRATVWVARSRFGGLCITHMKAVCNRAPARHMAKAILTWLDLHLNRNSMSTRPPLPPPPETDVEVEPICFPPFQLELPLMEHTPGKHRP